MPLVRGERFEEPLQLALEENGYGEVGGGGTLQASEGGEIVYCGIDVDLFDLDRGVPFVCDFLARLGAPRGSKLTYTLNEVNNEISFGTNEGVGVYLNGTDLPAEVYKNAKVDVVFENFEKLLGDRGEIWGHWRGPTEFALYLYGPSAQEMKARIAPFIAEYPLCQRARVVDIA
jgi:hypothetical protein